MREIEIKLQGRVQGVGLRRLIKNKVNSLNIKGFVLNNKDGSVTILSQGEKNPLNEFLSYLHSSPGFSKIEELNYKLQKSNKIYEDFQILQEKNILIDKAKSIINLGKFLIKEKTTIPKHIVIIPDGNRRWSTEKGLKSSFGHYKAASYSNLISLFEEAKNSGVKYLTIWGFSTENWKRSKEEKDAIFDLISKELKIFEKDAEKNKIRFLHLGRKDRLPNSLIKQLAQLEKKTKNYQDFNVQLCLDYGGRDEIIRAINKLLKTKIKTIDESSFSQFLDTSNIPDPDLIIRTSGEKRTSGILPFQSIYSELYFSDVYFPDFNKEELKKAIKEFSRRKRRFGS
ncbi:MAG: polyprenyl diphosphate synthase [Nanoarchaeota archaeon]